MTRCPVSRNVQLDVQRSQPVSPSRSNARSQLSVGGIEELAALPRGLLPTRNRYTQSILGHTNGHPHLILVVVRRWHIGSFVPGNS